jgi:hypothetical protein
VSMIAGNLLSFVAVVISTSFLYLTFSSLVGTNYGFIFLMFGLSCTFLIDTVGFLGWSFYALNYVFVVIGLIGALLCSQIRFLTSGIKDEKVLKHHRATSSVGSML